MAPELRTLLRVLTVIVFAVPAGVGAQVVIDLATDPADLTVWGSVRGGAGTDVAIGDWNGDGAPDLAVSENTWSDPGSGAQGRVAIYFGPFTFPSARDLGAEVPPVTVQVMADRLFRADLDGDGIDDLIAGGYTSSTISIFRGRAIWPPRVNTFDADWRFISRSDSMALAAVGDLNGDDAADLALGAFGASGPGDARSSAGEVYVFFGPTSRWTKSVYDLATDVPDVRILGADGSEDNPIRGKGDELGFTVHIGDVLGDRTADLAIGARWAQGPPGDPRWEAGEVYVFAGRPSWPATIDTRSESPDLLVYGRRQSMLGIEIATADWDADGKVDLLLGAPDTSDVLEKSRIYVLRGQAGLAGVWDLSAKAADMVLRGPTPGSRFGERLAPGDVNGDGFLDLVSSTPGGAVPPSTSYQGGAVVVSGCPGVQPVRDLAVDVAELSVTGADEGDGFADAGFAVGDVDLDGRSDVLIGSHTTRSRDNSRDAWSGEVHLILGRPFGPAGCVVEASAGPGAEVCGAGASVTLDASATAVTGCANDPQFRWLAGTDAIRDWSRDPEVVVAPLLATVYTVGVRCGDCSGTTCSGTASVLVGVDPDLVPGDLGNTLRSVRRGDTLAISWAFAPSARTYSLYRGTDRGAWPPAVSTGILGTTATLEDLPAPPSLYFYRVAGASCSGKEGP